MSILEPTAYTRFVAEAVELRIAAGDHPHDVMCDAWQMLEAWVYRYVDGAWPKTGFENPNFSKPTKEGE